MKSFVTEGTGSQQTLRNSQDNKIPIYDSVADVEADLANLTDGQIVATKDTGDELAQPVDVVEEDNLHAVSSNAVAEKFATQLKILECGTIAPASISPTMYINREITLAHTYKLSDKMGFMLTPVSYINTAYVTATGHWGENGADASQITQTNKLTVYITNLYDGASQTCGCYWAIYGKDSDIVS
jgi:hypothetical protein